MNYGVQHHLGNNMHSQKRTTAAIAPTTERVRRMDANTKGRKRSAERQNTVSTVSNVTDGFLNSVFLPKLQAGQSVKTGKETAKLERDFYKSLSMLAAHYRIEPMQTKDFGFPYNIALALWDMKTQLKRSQIYWNTLRLVQDSKKTFIVSEEKYNTGTTLFYIPIVPIFNMLHHKERSHTAKLLISVCSYLYHIADIPYYRQKNSYLYWMYELQKEWVELDDETEDQEPFRREFYIAEFIGDCIEQKLLNRHNLTFFEQRLSRFKSRDKFDEECWKVACKAFAIYTEYPTASLFRNTHSTDITTCMNDDHDGVISMDKYISFSADNKGWLYDSLSESINNEFNEYLTIEEPTIYKQFDGSEITVDNLEFENRLFELLEELSSVLYNYKFME